jgi:hypothetical protein
MESFLNILLLTLCLVGGVVMLIALVAMIGLCIELLKDLG